MIPRLCTLALALAAALAAQRTPYRAPSTDQRIAALEQRLKQAPKDAAIQNELAGAYLQKTRETADDAYLERTARIVDAILAADPSNYEARRHRFEIEMQGHHFKKSVTLAHALLRERPDDYVTWGLLGDALMELGEYDKAPDAYQKMVDLRPSLASYNRVAFYRFVTGDPEGAIMLMRKAIAIGAPAPENVAWCWSDLGDALFKTGAVDEAEKAYREALVLFPGFHHALAGLGHLQASRGRREEAIESFRRAQAAAPMPGYAAWLARLYGQLGREDLKRKQIEMLDAADKLTRAAGETANRDLTLALADLDHNTARALELARAELETRGDVYTWDALAWALFKNGQAEQAASAMRKALAQNTPEPAFREHAARIFAALGRPEPPSASSNRGPEGAIRP